MKILQSALKHGLTHDEIISAYEHPIYTSTQRHDPLKVLMIGMTNSCITIELYYTTRNNEIVVFHAMKCTNATMNRLKRATKR